MYELNVFGDKKRFRQKQTIALTHKKTKSLQDVYTDLLPLILHAVFNKYMFE